MAMYRIHQQKPFILNLLIIQIVLESYVVEYSMESFMHRDYRS